jgi:GNAT superfamily N-acetyltransferase
VGYVHSLTDVGGLMTALADSPELVEVYVNAELTGVVDALAAAGWRAEEPMRQLVWDAWSSLPEAQSSGPLAVVELSAADLPGMRALLLAEGVDERIVAGHYPDDFFAVAAPVRVVGAHVGGELVASVAVRRQVTAAFGFALNVRADWRGTGLGRAVVESALRAAGELGAAFVHVQATASGSGCLESCGFVRAGTWQPMLRG